MAFKELQYTKYISDLVIGHLPFHFSVDNANITPPAASAPIMLGTVVFRAKGLGVAAPWAVLTSAGVAPENEFAVVYGDELKCNFDFVPRAIAAGRFNSVVIKRDAQFKEYYIKQFATTAGLDAATLDTLKQLMADQGLLVLDDVTGYKDPSAPYV